MSVTVTQTYPSEFQRTGITIPDPDASILQPIALSPGLTFRVGASCTTPNATLALRLYLLDSQGRVITVQPITFATGLAADWGAAFQGTPNVEPWFSVGPSKNLAIKVDAVSPGSNWTVAGAWSP